MRVINCLFERIDWGKYRCINVFLLVSSVCSKNLIYILYHVVSITFYVLGTRRVHSNVVYQEFISDRNHLHMNSTQVCIGNVV